MLYREYSTFINDKQENDICDVKVADGVEKYFLKTKISQCYICKSNHHIPVETEVFRIETFLT